MIQNSLWINEYECREFTHTHTHTHKYDKSGQNKRRQSEIDGVVQKRLSRFPGLRNNLVSTFSNPDLQGQTVPLAGPLGRAPGERVRRRERATTPARMIRVQLGWEGFLFFFFSRLIYCFSLVRNDAADSVLSRQFARPGMCWSRLAAPARRAIIFADALSPHLRLLQRGVGGPHPGGAFSPRSAQPRVRQGSSPCGAGPEGRGVNVRETESLLARVPSVPNVLGSWEGLNASSRKSYGLCHAESWENRPLGSVW